MKFPLLFSPFTLRGVEIRNRIVSTAHGTYMSSHGLPNRQVAAYHEARARGGAGLIICEAASIHSSGVGAGRYATAHTDECIEPYRQVVSAIRQHGAVAFGQLYHPGRGDIAGSSDDGTVSVAYAPSPVACERNQLMPREMSAPLIREVITAYGDAAARMTSAGFQGIEVMAHHGHLVSQFLNPRVNRRTDEYGGDLEARSRFLQEILEQVRARIRTDMPIGVRICGDEMDDEGLDAEETLPICCWLEQTGLVDYLSVNLGSSSSARGGMHVVATMRSPVGYIGPYAGAIRSVVSLPVLATGRINDPEVAEQILADGQADLCGMTRAQICDPELAEKARSGNPENIRVCIACNQACIGHGVKGAAISCIQYPESGRELDLLPRPKAAESKQILVAGAGPAGLKAAAVAAECGHQVTIFEVDTEVGGQARLAALLPGREEFARLATNLEAEARRAGVEIVTRTRVSRELIEKREPHAVIVATGGREYLPALDIQSQAHTVTALQVVRNEANVGARVVIADFKLDATALRLAEKLARDGCSVRLAVIGDVPGQNVPVSTRNFSLGELHKLGVEVLPHLKLIGCDEARARFIHTMSGQPVECPDLDTLVISAGVIHNNELERELEDYRGDVRFAGDCLAPRGAEEAVLEGLKAGLV